MILTGFSWQSLKWPSAWLVLEPSKPQSGSSSVFLIGPSTNFVFERSFAVGF